MTDYPNFSPNNYQIISELGRNNLGGRVTYLAQQTTTKQQVVIKQFQFAKMGASWAEYDAYEQEIAMLRHLNHPGIPKYLDSFQTADGFCMVQEYINAQSLAVSRSWSPIEIKKVALATLEILVYLQSLNPSVIHRDIKPENILADENLNIYLVDFGFARLGGGEIAASSVVKGTMGFMPPEQLFNRQLTTASDLYGLGATLICLLTGTTSGSLGNLIDENYEIQFKNLVPPLKRGLISWLEKISQPNPKHRYANAAEALKVLKSLDVDRLPKVRISKDNFKLVAQGFREKVTETITISNPIPGTVLTGRWEVAPHPSDPPHTPYDHAWIEFDSYQFEGNEIECKITVDTSKLLAGESYQRELLLHTNSGEESLTIPMLVATPNWLEKSTLEKLPYFWSIVIISLGLFLLSPPLFLFVVISFIVARRIITSAYEKNIFTKYAIAKEYFLNIFLYSLPGSLCLVVFSYFYNKVELGLLFYLTIALVILTDVGTLMGTKMLGFTSFEVSSEKENNRNNFDIKILGLSMDFPWFSVILIISFLVLTNWSSIVNTIQNSDLTLFLLILKMLTAIIFVFLTAIVLAIPIAVLSYCIIKSKIIVSLPKSKMSAGLLQEQNVRKFLFLSYSLTFSGLLSYSMLQKLNGLTLTNNLEILALLVSIFPTLIVGFLCSKSVQPLKYLWKVARYHREKPNLIKP